MSDLIVFIYCLPAFLITCVMLFLAFLIKHKEAEKRVFERGALDGKASMEAHGETEKVSPVRSTSAQRKKLLDKRLKITAEGVALMRRTGEAFGEPCDRSGSSVRPAKRQSSGFIRQSHRACEFVIHARCFGDSTSA